MKKEHRIRINLKSLKADEIRTFKQHLNDSLSAYFDLQDERSGRKPPRPGIEITEETLTKAKLRGYQAPDNYDITILIHKGEGRLFLTDRNGFYNDLLTHEWSKTKGNVLIVLTANRTSVPPDKIVNGDVQTMATQGDQPTLLLFDAKKRIFTWNKVPSEL